MTQELSRWEVGERTSIPWGGGLRGGPAVTHWFHPRPQEQRDSARNKDSPGGSTNTQSKPDMAEGS